jgi:predicted nucleotidyltransferase
LRAELGRHGEISLAYLFGSVARGESGEGSDVDVAVLASTVLGLDDRSRLSEELARALGFRWAVGVVDLRQASPVLAAEVVRDGVRLVERDPLVRFDFEMEAIRRFEDTRGLRRLQHELLREGARGRP